MAFRRALFVISRPISSSLATFSRSLCTRSLPDLTALKNKRLQQKRRPQVQIQEEIDVAEQQSRTIVDPMASPGWQVIAYATAEEYDLESLGPALSSQGLYSASSKAEDIHDVLHFTAKYTTGGHESRQVYLFREGSVVFWNVPEIERGNLMLFLRAYEHVSHDETIVSAEAEAMHYSYTDSAKTRLVNDRILLNGEGSLDLEKYTFSNALTRSVKLGIWEATLDRFVDNIEHVVDELKGSGRVKMGRQEVLRKSGELFALRHLMNLTSDLLSTPDFYWDRENLEALYKKTCNHLNIHRRTSIMNEKLNYCCQLVELLSSHLQDRHHVRLEWMIIALIMIEVIFELIHFVK